MICVWSLVFIVFVIQQKHSDTKLTSLHAVPGSAVGDSLLLAKIVAVIAAARSLGVAHGGVIQCVHQRKMPILCKKSNPILFAFHD